MLAVILHGLESGCTRKAMGHWVILKHSEVLIRVLLL
jgi:hypothetical protein